MQKALGDKSADPSKELQRNAQRHL